MSTLITKGVKHPSSTETNLTLDAGGSVQVTSLNSGPLAGLHNQLINPDFRVWQRGTSVVHGASNGGYTADRWVGAANTTTSQRNKHGNIPVAEVLGDKYLLQGVELHVNPYDNSVTTQFAVGSTWTLSYYATKAPDGVISNIAEFRDSVNDGTASSNPVSIATISTPTATGETLGSGNELVRYSTTFTVTGTPASTNRSAVFHLAGNSSDVDFAYAQLEPGSVASAFEERPLSLEMSLCQRYYETGSWKAYLSTTTAGTMAGAATFIVRKRTGPTITYSTGANRNHLPTSTEWTEVDSFGFQKTSANELAFLYAADAEL